MVRIALTILIGLYSMAANAEQMQFDVSLSATWFDAGQDDGFERAQSLSAHFNYNLLKWLAADVGVFVSDKAYEPVREDVVGEYQTNIQTKSAMIGVKSEYQFTSPFSVYGRLGISWWETELEVEEYFGEGIPGGTESATDTGWGYYGSVGGAYRINDKVNIQLELTKMKQPDVFKGQSGFPFDLTITTLGIGAGVRF
ncbi:outer membrane beta-barrel protein [Kaarinaea lacus]